MQLTAGILEPYTIWNTRNNLFSASPDTILLLVHNFIGQIIGPVLDIYIHRFHDQIYEQAEQMLKPLKNNFWILVI